GASRKGKKEKTPCGAKHHQPEKKPPPSHPLAAQTADKRSKNHAGYCEAGDHKAHFERRAAQRGDVKRKRRLQQCMLRRAKKLCATEQSKRRRPQCVGFSRCHLIADLMKRFFAGACRVGDRGGTAKRP